MRETHYFLSVIIGLLIALFWQQEEKIERDQRRLRANMKPLWAEGAKWLALVGSSVVLLYFGVTA